MKIYTKSGDRGSTKLIGGKDVEKHNIQVDVYGSIDELNSYIGLIRDFTDDKYVKNSLIEIQKNLFNIGAILAFQDEKTAEKYLKTRKIGILKEDISTRNHRCSVASHLCPSSPETLWEHIAESQALPPKGC